MKLLVVCFALVAIAAAAPADQAPIAIVRSQSETSPEGGYNYSFESENGISVQETGEVKETLDEDNKPHKVVVARGSYAYTDPEGNPVQISYVADEHGFQAEGAAIPQLPARR